jgi:hypothetical protein
MKKITFLVKVKTNFVLFFKDLFTMINLWQMPVFMESSGKFNYLST